MTEVRLRGIARRIGSGDGPLAGGCRLVVGDDAEAHTQDGELELDGARIEVPSSAVVGERTKKAPYSELADEPGVAAMRLKPGPHVTATLIQRWIRDGDEIEVVAEPGEARLGQAGYREAAPETPTYRALAAGPARSVATWHSDRAWRRELERRKAMPPVKRKPPWIAIAMGLWLAMAAALAAGFWFAPSTYSYVSPNLVFALGGSAAAIAWGEVSFPGFDGKRTTSGVILMLVGTLAIGTCLPPTGPVAALILAGTALAGIGFAAAATMRGAHLLGLLVSRPVARPDAGKFGVFAGRVYDPTPISVDGKAAAVGQIITRVGTGSDAEIDITKLSDSTFFVRSESDGGFELEVHPDKLEWASDSYGESDEKKKDRHRSMSYVPVGADVLIAGTPKLVDGVMHLRHTGPESLVMFGTSAGDPATVARRMLRERRAVLLGALLLATAEIALALVGFRDGW